MSTQKHNSTGNIELEQLTTMAEQTTQSTCSAVLLTARELIKSPNQKFAIEQIKALSDICSDSCRHLDESSEALEHNNQKTAQICLNESISSLMHVSSSALSADISATQVASNDTALFRTSRK